MNQPLVRCPAAPADPAWGTQSTMRGRGSEGVWSSSGPSCTAADDNVQKGRDWWLPDRDPQRPTPRPCSSKVQGKLSMRWGPLLPRDLCVNPLFRQITEQRTPTPRMGKGPRQADCLYNWWGPQQNGNRSPLFKVGKNCRTAMAEHGLGPRQR